MSLKAGRGTIRPPTNGVRSYGAHSSVSVRLQKPNRKQSSAQLNQAQIFLFLFMTFFTVRVFITPSVLDLLYNYTREGGAAWGKIHIGSLGLIALGLSSIAKINFGRARAVKFTLLCLAGACIFGVVSSIFRGETGSLGYAIDNLFTAAMVGVAALRLGRENGRTLATIVVVFASLDSVICLIEYIRHSPFIPQHFTTELWFRPSGLAGHPLFVGMWSVLGVPLCFQSRLPSIVKPVVAILLCAATAAVGARVATAVCAVEFLIVMAVSGRRSFSRLLLMGLLGSILVAGLFTMAKQAGFLTRFEARGIYDKSAATRVDVYKVLSLLSAREVMFGSSQTRVAALAKEQSDIDIIESPVIIYITQFGLVGSTIIILPILGLIILLCLKSPLGLTVGVLGFFGAGAGTLIFATKEAQFIAFVGIYVPLCLPNSGLPREKGQNSVDRRMES